MPPEGRARRAPLRLVVRQEIMKYRTALRQSSQGVWISCIISLTLWAAYAWFKWWQIATVAIFASLFAFGDLVNIIYIKYKSNGDTHLLDKNIK